MNDLSPPEPSPAEATPPEPPSDGRLVRSSSRDAAFVVALVALITLAPLATPVADRPIELAVSPTAPALEAGASTNADVTVSDDTVPDDVRVDVVTESQPLSVEATIQRRLVDHGWAVTVDGVIGAQTRRAIAEFQHANGLPPTGDVDAETGIRLGAPDANGHERYLADPLPPPAAPTPSPPAAPASGAAREASDPMTRIEQIADSVGFDWRGQGVTFITDCHPSPRRCATGSYYTGTREIFITKRILTEKEVLRSVVLHELAHAWQFTVRGWPEAENDVSAWGRTGIDGLEAAADCLAAAWGASRTYHWSCPADARAHMLSLYQHS
jgi:predicted SprT family Zn-dependent metalloprotease